jgi:hypothetical protein
MAEHLAGKAGARDRHTFCDGEDRRDEGEPTGGAWPASVSRLCRHPSLEYASVPAEISRGGNSLEEEGGDMSVGMRLGH